MGGDVVTKKLFDDPTPPQKWCKFLFPLTWLKSHFPDSTQPSDELTSNQKYRFFIRKKNIGKFKIFNIFMPVVISLWFWSFACFPKYFISLFDFFF